MSNTNEIKNEKLNAFVGLYGTQKDAENPDHWNLLFGAFALGWDENEQLRAANAWRVISRDGLPSDRDDYLWQFMPDDIRKPNEYFVGRYVRISNSVVSRVGSYQFGVGRLFAWRELPAACEVKEISEQEAAK